MGQLEFGLHYSLQTHEGDWAELYDATVDQARLAEQLGFTSLNVAEHHFLDDGWIPAPMVMLGGMAAVTNEITIGTEITILPLHNPIKIAEHAVVLDVMTRGNFRLGVAIGWREQEFEVFGIPLSERVPRTVESIELIRKLFSEENVTYDGEYFSVSELTVTPRPIQDSLEIRYGGQSEHALRRAARIADSWLMSPIESRDDLRSKIDLYKEALDNNNRSWDGVDKPLRRELYVARDDDTAWDEVGESLLSEYVDVYSTGYDDVNNAFGSEDSDSALETLREFADDRFIVGGPETVIEQIEHYQQDIGVDELLLRMHFPSLDPDLSEKSMRVFAEDVMPHF